MKIVDEPSTPRRPLHPAEETARSADRSGDGSAAKQITTSTSPDAASESASPTIHSMRLAGGVASFAARIASGFRSMPVSATRNPALRRPRIDPAAAYRHRRSPRPPRATALPTTDEPQSTLHPRNRGPIGKGQPIYSSDVTQAGAKLLITARLDPSSRRDLHGCERSSLEGGDGTSVRSRKRRQDFQGTESERTGWMSKASELAISIAAETSPIQEQSHPMQRQVLIGSSCSGGTISPGSKRPARSGRRSPTLAPPHRQPPPAARRCRRESRGPESTPAAATDVPCPERPA